MIIFIGYWLEFMYRRENKKLSFINLPQWQNNNFKFCIFRKHVLCMNSLLRGVKPSLDWLCVHVERLPLSSPFSLSYDWCLVRTAPPSLWLAWLANLNWVLGKVSSERRIAVTWTCDQLDWVTLIIIFSDNNSLPIINPIRKSKLTLVLGCHSACFWLGCLILFSNPPLSIIREGSPWFILRLCRPDFRLAITRTIWSKWTRACWSLELVLRVFATNNKDQPPPHDHLKSLLIRVNSIKMIPLVFCNMPLEHLVRFPN